MFTRLPDKPSLPALEEDTLEVWKAHRIFEQSMDRPDAPDFTFYEGPPTANGKPGIHHVMARTIKDLVCRYKTMRGYQVHRKAGWDTHGLPVEIEVERKLGIRHKEEIEKYGIDRFNAECRKSVFEYKDLWESLTVRHLRERIHRIGVVGAGFLLQERPHLSGVPGSALLPPMRHAIVVS